MGNPKRTDLPAGIGRDPDHVVALREDLTRQAIQHLRRVNGIPPANEPWRSRWFAKRDVRPDEWCGTDWGSDSGL
jgi:hypothetical protein